MIAAKKGPYSVVSLAGANNQCWNFFTGILTLGLPAQLIHKEITLSVACTLGPAAALCIG